MKGAKIACVIVVWAAIVTEVRMGESYPLPQVLPFCSGRPVGIYDLAGCTALFTFFVLLGQTPQHGGDAHGLNTQAVLPAAKKRDDARRRFRQSLWLVPLALAFAAYISRNVEPSIHWQDVLDLLYIKDPTRFSQLAVLIATCAAILAIKYIWQRR